MTTALLVFYSRLSRDRLERILRSQGIEVYPISGRAPDATETVRRHPADVVVIDKDVADISVTQAVRHIAQILPRRPIFTASTNNQKAEVFRKGRRIGTVNLGEIAHFATSGETMDTTSRYKSSSVARAPFDSQSDRHPQKTIDELLQQLDDISAEYKSLLGRLIKMRLS